jgi:hypothetical protein
MTDPKLDYTSRVYSALKDNLQGFDKTPGQFLDSMQDPDYRSRVYAALKDNLQGFDKTPEEFNNSVVPQKKNSLGTSTPTQYVAAPADLTESSPSSDAATPSSSQSASQPAAFDPNTFMSQSRANVLGNQSAQDNLSAQANVPKQVVQKQVQEIQQNANNSVKAEPVTKQAQIKTDDQPFDLTKSIETDFPGTDPNQILGNKDLLSGYYKQKNDLLQNQINQMEASEKRGVMGGAIAKLKDEQQALTQQVYHYNSIHAGLEGGGDPVKTGLILGQSMGDPQAAQQARLMAKGIPINPIQQVNTENAGIDAQITTLNAQNDNDPQNPQYLQQLANLQNQKATILQRHPEALRQLWSDKIGEYIAKHLTPLEINTGIYPKSLSEYISDMKKDGIDVPDAVAKNISWPDNLPKDMAGKLLSGFMGTFSNMAGGIERMGGNTLGVDKDVLNQDIQQGQTNLNKNFNLDNPESEALANKVLPQSSITAGNVMKGIGSLASFVLTANNVGKVAENVLADAAPGMTDAASTALANHIGTDATVFASSYEPNYQKARQIIGDNPGDEGKRNVSAMLGSLIDAAVFHLPIGKYGDALTAGKTELTDVIKDLPSDLQGLSSETLNTNLKKYLQKPLANILESAKNTTEEAGKFGAMQTAGVLLKHISQSVIANNKNSSEDWANVPSEIADEWETLPTSLMPGIFGINLLGGMNASNFRKQSMYDAFANPQRTLSDLGKAQDAGLITPDEYAKRAEVINVGSKILNETPQSNPSTGQPLTHDQAVTWVNNRLQEYALEAKKTGVKDDKVLFKFYDGKIKELQGQREQILNPVAPVIPEAKVSEKPVEKPIEKTAPVSAAEKPAEPVSSPVISDLTNSDVVMNDERGKLRTDEENNVLFDNGTKETLLGKTTDEKFNNSNASDYGIKPAPKVEVKGDNVNIDGEDFTLKPNGESFNKDNNGNLASVTLTNSDGQDRTFRDKELALDVAIAKNQHDFESKLEPPDYAVHQQVVNDIAKKSLGQKANDIIDSMPEEVADTFAAMDNKIEALAPEETQAMVIRSSEWADQARQKIAESDSSDKEKADATKMLDKFDKDLNKYYGKLEKQRKSQANADVKRGQAENLAAAKQRAKAEREQAKQLELEDTRQQDLTEGFGGRSGRTRLYKMVNEVDEPTDVEGKILQYFAGGGKVHPDSFSTEVVHKKRAGYGEQGTQASDVKDNTLVKATDENGKLYPTVSQLAEGWGDGTNDHEIRNKIISTLQEHGSREDAATKFVNTYHLEHIQAMHDQAERDHWEAEHQKEVAAEEKWLEDEANKQSEFESTPEYVQQLIDHESSKTSPNAETTDTGSKKEGNTSSGSGQGNAKSGGRNTDAEGGDKSTKPEPDKSKPADSQQQGDKGQPVKEKVAKLSTEDKKSLAKAILSGDTETVNKILGNEKLDKSSKMFKLGEQDTFYHASNKKRVGKLEENDATQFGKGIYFTTEKDKAVNEFGNHVTEAKLNIENPVYTNTKDWANVTDLAEKNAINDYNKKHNFTEDDNGYKQYWDYSELPSKYISDAAKELGFDAIVDKHSAAYKNEILVLDKNKVIYPEDNNSKQTNNAEINTDNGKMPIEQYVSRAKSVLSSLFPEAKFETYDKTSDYVANGGPRDSRGVSKVDAEGNRTIMLDLQKLREDGSGRTAFHEVIHPIVDEVVGEHPEELNPLWNDLAQQMQGVEGFDAVLHHTLNYGVNEHPAAEGITELLTQISEGNIKLEDIPPAKKGVIIDLLNKILEKLGLKIRFGQQYDFKSFATDIKKAFDTGDTESLKKVVDKGNGGSDKADKGNSIPDRIQQLKDLDYSDDEIKDTLKDLGYKDDQIKQLLSPENKYTSIKNQIVDDERAQQGKQPLKSTGDGTMDAFDKTKARIESGDISLEHIRDLSASLASGFDDFHTNLSVTEMHHALLYDRNTLQQKGAEIDNGLTEAREKGDKKAEAMWMGKRAQNEMLLENNDLAARRLGREWSDVGRARQLLIKQDYTLEALTRKYKAANGGDIPEHVKDKLRDLAKQVESKDLSIQDMQSKQAEAEKEISDLKLLIEGEKENRKNNADQQGALDNLAKEVKSQVKSQGKRTIEKIKFERENIKASLKNKWQNHIKGGSAGMNNIIPLDMVPDLVKLAKSYIEEGLAVGKEAILDKIIDRVHKDVVDALGNPDIDKTSVRDAITGYGKIKKPNDNPVEKAFRDITAQGRLVSSIELANKGENPLKSGAQRDKPTPEQRRLQKELNKAIKDNNIQVKSPEEQIKTSLDAAKTRLKNQIEDLSDAIDRNEKIVKDRKGIEYDQEANDLKAQRDDLRDEYDKVFGTNKELTDEDRIERASKAVQKSIDKLTERISNKDFSQNKKTDLKSESLDALKKKREDLKNVYNKLMDAEGETNRRKLEAMKKNIAKRTAYLKEIRDTNNLDKLLADRVKKKTVLDAEALKLRAEQQKVKNDVDNMIGIREFNNMGALGKAIHWGNRFVNGVLISNPVILARIIGSVIGRATFKAPTEAVKYGVSKMFPELAKGAHTEAITTRHDLAEHIATFYSTLFSKENFQDMKFAFKNHNTKEDLTLGRNYKKLPIPDIKVTGMKTFIQNSFFQTMKVLDKNASLHGAEKSLVSLPEYRAYQKTIGANLIREGVKPEELGNATLQEAINQRAFRKSLRAKFMQDNFVTKLQGDMEEGLRRRGMPNGAELVKGLAPITKISSNYISEALTKMPVVGMTAAYKPIFKIFSNALGKDSPLSENEKSVLLRTLTFQGVGALTYALGYALHSHFNPFYQSSASKYAQQKQGDEESPWLKLYETLSHFPDALVFNAGVSHGWVWDKYDQEHPGEASMSTFMGSLPNVLAENARSVGSSSPYLQSASTVINPLVTGKGLGKAAANFIKARTPFSTTSSEIAQGQIPVLNKFGIKSGHEEKVKPYEVGIYPKTFMDNIKMGVPGWRQEVLKKLLAEKEAKKPHETNLEKHDAKIKAHEKAIKTAEFKQQIGE